MAAGFAEALNLDLNPAQLTPDEIRCAAELIRTRYAHPEWTRHR